MAKVTSKLQVTIPKAIAKRHGIKPGDEIEFRSVGDFIRIVPPGVAEKRQLSLAERQRLFDEMTERQRRREAAMKLPKTPPKERDWKREDLYTRGKPR